MATTKPQKKSKAPKQPTPLTRSEKSTLSKILGKARAFQAFYRASGKAPPKR